MLSRRTLLEAATLFPLFHFASAPLLAAAGGGFTHSVASGDPSPHAVVLWTRFVPPGGGYAALKVEVAQDEAFTRIVMRGMASAGPETDFCAHAHVDGLMPGRWYYYRFITADGQTSPVGRTRTLPVGRLDSFRIGVVSCANATSGWFNGYAHAAARDDLDLIVHTGDYIYESPIDRADALAGLAAARHIQPNGAAVSLSDYRLRYASYRADPGLLELHRRFPMIIMWDDHEVANNSWQNGAKDHDLQDGSWDMRKGAGVRAFREWLPMGNRDYAAYQIGNLATLFRLETRLIARSKQLELAPILLAPDRAAALNAFLNGPLADPARTMMGARQEQWLADALAKSTATGTRWQVIAQQVIVAPTRLPKVTSAWYSPGDKPGAREQFELSAAEALGAAGVPTALDRWDGYPAARKRLFDSAIRANAKLIMLSGDSHNGWAFNLEQDGKPIGVEFAGHSISSLGLEKRFSGDPAGIARDILAVNPALKWCDTSQRGYMVVDLHPRRVTSEWLFLPSRGISSTAILGSHTETAEYGAQRLSGL
ncbi:MAG: alkaline phosphatase D family protein [Sphingomonas sp.]